MENQKRLESGKLLDNTGNLIQAGYAVYLAKEYCRQDIKAPKHRIKEWDSYYFGDFNKGVSLTIADYSYIGLASVSFMNYESFHYKTCRQVKFFSNGKLNFPSSSISGDVEYKNKRIQLNFVNELGKREIYCHYKNFYKLADLEIRLKLDPPDCQSIVIATPFSKNAHFHYNQKINCISGRGYVKYGDQTYEFDQNAMGALDWGRGVLTYANTWYHSSINGYIDGKKFGINLGYSFNDKSAASENIIFYDGMANKLGKVVFSIPITAKKENFLKPWKITDDKNRLDLMFFPRIDRYESTDIGIYKNNQHQVFGHFIGAVVLDNGKVLTLEPTMGFVQKVIKRW